MQSQPYHSDSIKSIKFGSILTKYIQGVPTPREILKETLRFIWQENTTNLLLSNERKSHRKACSTIINCR